jgi:hypothetical protein
MPWFSFIGTGGKHICLSVRSYTNTLSAIANAFKRKHQQPLELEDDPLRALESRNTWAIDRYLADKEPVEGGTAGSTGPGGVDDHLYSSEHSPTSSIYDIGDSVTDEDDELDIPGIKKYIALTSEDPAYNWLISRLHRELFMSWATPDSLKGIRNAILDSLPRNKEVSKKKCSESTCITYSVDWDIQTFLQGEYYEEPDHEAIAYAITITGSWSNAQALTTQQYLEQTWPLTGVQTLDFIQMLLRSAGNKAKRACKYGSIPDMSIIVTALIWCWHKQHCIALNTEHSYQTRFHTELHRA